MLIIVAKIIANVKFYLRDYLAVAGIIVPSAVLFVVLADNQLSFTYYLFNILLCKNRVLFYNRYIRLCLNNVHK